MFVADVGGNDYATAYEEVDLGAAGANYAWPNCEHACASPPYTNGVYDYPHSGRDAAITGGFVYHGTQFPSDYRGSYFFADYTQNWIKRLTFDASGTTVAQVLPFEPANGANDGPYGDIVYLTEGPDGALYYLDLGYSDIGGTFGVSKLRRISFNSGDQPPTAIAAADPAAGPTPLSVAFSSAGSAETPRDSRSPSRGTSATGRARPPRTRRTPTRRPAPTRRACRSRTAPTRRSPRRSRSPPAHRPWSN
jgi:hypothetical protein